MSSVDTIKNEIKKLTVMELVTLVKDLQEEFGVSAMPVAAAVASHSDAAPVAVEEEKSQYKVTLKDSGTEKLKVIKALRTIVTSLSLTAAKEAVENVPTVVAEALPKDEAQKAKKTLEEAGAKVDLS